MNFNANSAKNFALDQLNWKWKVFWQPLTMFCLYISSQISHVDSSVWPKFDICAEFQQKVSVSVSVSEPKYFLPKPNFFFLFQNFSKFVMYFYFLGEYKFLKTWNWTQIFKRFANFLKIWQQIWFKGLFYDWKNTPYYR